MSPASPAPSDPLRLLAASVIPEDAAEPFGVYVFRSDDDRSELARHVERVVFLEAFGNTTELLAKEYAPYEQASMFLCVLDQRRHLPVGMMRVVMPSPAGFKSLLDVEPVWGVDVGTLFGRAGLVHEPERTWDVATLAVAAEYRGRATTGLVSMGLYQTLTRIARRCGVDWLVAIFDVAVLRMIRWKLRMTFTGFTGVGAASYLGSPASIPAWCRISDADRRLGDADPVLHAVLFDGVGIEPAVRPADVEHAWRLVA
ncbi:MAG TPA: hypothetical protein VEI83_13945 [Acidimicrobiales bacterium]|nr:hypothetical protein [Acidimicrobiales bacterium]